MKVLVSYLPVNHAQKLADINGAIISTWQHLNEAVSDPVFPLRDQFNKFKKSHSTLFFPISVKKKKPAYVCRAITTNVITELS